MPSKVYFAEGASTTKAGIQEFIGYSPSPIQQAIIIVLVYK
jgi:hypothetical protein